MDTDKNGVLTREELIEAYSERYGNSKAEREVDSLLQAWDVDKNGSIDINEFKAAAMDKKKLFSADNLRKAFNDLDKDRTGKIKANEL